MQCLAYSRGAKIAQQGTALIVLVFMLGLAMVAVILDSYNRSALRSALDTRTAQALAEAKAVLIGRAIGDINRPGSLPCPDGNGDGSADAMVGNECPTYIGRFPWKTLGAGELRDGTGELLWYGLTNSYRDDDSAEPINGTAAGQWTVDGVADRVAVLFAPGPGLAGQGGRPSNAITDYLEGENADGDQVATQVLTPNLNDRVIGIGRAELAAAVAQRILREIRGDSTQGLLKYYADNASNFPNADTTGDGVMDAPQLAGTLPYNNLVFDVVETGPMLINNGWLPLVGAYTVSADLQQSSMTLHGKTLVLNP